jgi:hypothetical protein
MLHRLNTAEFECDSLPYALVKACRKIGLRDPEDVRWCRLSNFRSRIPGWRDLFSLRTWKALFGLWENGRRGCTCGQQLPVLEKYTFTLKCGRQEDYLLGQCSVCRAIYWEQP